MNKNLSPWKAGPPGDAILRGECGNCGSKERRILHCLWLRGMSRRVCTSCVLRLHPSFFCPSCFDFFDNPLSNTSSASAHRFLSCTKCSSLTHLSCLPSPPPPSSSFLCPPCSQPNFSFFPPSTAPLDAPRALVLLCASKVAAASLSKSLSLSRSRVDRTSRDAALARKRARDSLDHCSILHKINRLRLQGTFHVSNSTYLGFNHNNLLTNQNQDFDAFTAPHDKVNKIGNNNNDNLSNRAG